MSTATELGDRAGYFYLWSRRLSTARHAVASIRMKHLDGDTSHFKGSFLPR